MLHGLIINITPSMRIGWYSPTDETPKLGSIVSVYLSDVTNPELAEHLFGRDFVPAQVAGKAPSQQRLLKRVVAMAGDQVAAEGDSISINGRVAVRRYLPHEARKEAGCDMPNWTGRRVLGENEVLLLGDGADGVDVRNLFDGRYIGPISKHLLERVWRYVSAAEFDELAVQVDPAYMRAGPAARSRSSSSPRDIRARAGVRSD